MQIRIRPVDAPLSPALRERLARRLRLAIGPRAGGIVRVDLTLARTAAGACCRVRVRPRHGPAIDVAGEQADLALALDEAAWRIEHRLAGRGDVFGADGLLGTARDTQGERDGSRSHPGADPR
jgi:ribosome-associated translation inhibitor RaiA